VNTSNLEKGKPGFLLLVKISKKQRDEREKVPNIKNFIKVTLYNNISQN
ncbi:26306_t:CDS:1, partial [Gigaspora rosea]